MNNLTKTFLLSFLSMIVTISMIILLTHKTQIEDLKTFNKIVKLPTIALSTSYLEPKLRAYNQQKTKLHPTLKKINYMDFVYGK